MQPEYEWHVCWLGKERGVSVAVGIVKGAACDEAAAVAIAREALNGAQHYRLGEVKRVKRL